MDALRDLHQFIQDMSKSEKRFFCLQATLGGQRPAYLEFYELLVGLREFDANRIGEQSKLGNRLHWTANHLWEKLLTAMRQYHLQYDIGLQLQQMISDIAFLWARGHTKKCKTYLRKAERLARRFQRDAQLLEILEWQRRIEIKELRKGYAERFESAVIEKKNALDRIHLTYAQLDIRQRLLLQARRMSPPVAIEYDADPPVKETQFRARHEQLFAAAISAQIQGNYSQAYNIYETILLHFAAYPDFRWYRQREYILILNNYLNLGHAIGNYERFESILGELEQIKARDLDEEAEIFQNSRFLRLLWYMNSNQLGRAADLPQEIRVGLVKYGDRINPSRRLAFSLNLCFYAFITEKYDVAWHWNQRILREKQMEIREDISTFAQLFVLVLSYQMKDEYFLESALQAAYQRQLRATSENKFLAIAIRRMRELLRTSEPGKVAADWMQDMDDCSRERDGKAEFGQGELKLWLQSLRSGRSMVEILRSNGS